MFYWYFFFSLDFRILVGAPLGQNSQPGTNHSGALFKCPITQNTNDCSQVITDGRRCKSIWKHERSLCIWAYHEINRADDQTKSHSLPVESKSGIFLLKTDRIEYASSLESALGSIKPRLDQLCKTGYGFIWPLLNLNAMAISIFLNA